MNEYDQSISQEYQEKINAVRKSELDIPDTKFQPIVDKNPNLEFFLIKGSSKFWKEDNSMDLEIISSNILSSINQHDVPFIFALLGDTNGINICIGTATYIMSSVIASYRAAFPGIDIEILKDNPLGVLDFNYGGAVTGIPSKLERAETGTVSIAENKRIENICRAMLGASFSYVVIAKGISPLVASNAHQRVLLEMGQVHELTKRTMAGGAQGNINIETQNYVAKSYLDNLENLENQLKTGLSKGLWRVSEYYAAQTYEDSMKLAGILKAVYSGDGSIPEPIRITPLKDIRVLLKNCWLLVNLSDNYKKHPTGCWHQAKTTVNLFSYKFQTILNSNQLGVLCKIPSEEFPGYYLNDYVEFDTANRLSKYKKDFILGKITSVGGRHWTDLNNNYYFNSDDFTRHALIVGVTGGGKSNTSKALLSQLWNSDKHVPFLVIESAKREYWELRNMTGMEDLIVFTLGSEETGNSVKYRLNPFECIPGISLQTHIDYLLSTFKAAFELYPPMPYALETAVYEVYTDKGWDITENINLYGRKLYPTLSDLYNKIDVVVKRLGYDREVQSNVKAALKARIGSLMVGGKGAMMNTSHSVPIGKLLSRPVVMELEDLGDDDTKSFVIGMLMVQLYEYRKSLMSSGSKELQHILLIEEAHRLLKNIPETGEGGNPRAKSIEFFCNMLAEIRTYGQGIIVADQIPTKLAPDTIKNTNLKIVHRIVAGDDRNVIGNAMNMNEEQMQYLSTLDRGYAAVYSEGDNKPKNVKFPLVKPVFSLPRKTVLANSNTSTKSIFSEYDKRIDVHAGCAFCESKCKYYNSSSAIISQYVCEKKLPELIDTYKESLIVINEVLANNKISEWCADDIDKQLCLVGQLLSYSKELSDGEKQEKVAAYLKKTYNNSKE